MSKTTNAKDPGSVAALKMHREIVSEAGELCKKWTVLARKCLQFREAKHYKKVTNAETRKPFTSFTQWAEFVFKKSKSTIFAATRIVRELDGLVPDADIEAMPKENAETLVEAKAEGEPITPQLVEAAKTEPAKELRKKIASVRQIDEDKKAVASTRKLGPYRVSALTAAQFERALSIATEKTASESGEETDRAIALIATTFFTGIVESEGVEAQEVAA